MESRKVLDLEEFSIEIHVISHKMLDKFFSVAIRTQGGQYASALP